METTEQIKEVEEKEITYPTKPDADGFYYEDEGEAALEIETCMTGDDIKKRIKLTRGRTAIMRELTKKESDQAAQIAGAGKKVNQGRIIAAYIACSTTSTDKDGKKLTFVAEDLDGWKTRDTNRLEAAAAKLNF